MSLILPPLMSLITVHKILLNKILKSTALYLTLVVHSMTVIISH